jgi:hypothetical protein
MRPYCHVKIFAVTRVDVDLNTPIKDVEGLEVAYRATSDELSSTVFITREQTQPRWTAIELAPVR